MDWWVFSKERAGGQGRGGGLGIMADSTAWLLRFLDAPQAVVLPLLALLAAVVVALGVRFLT